MKKWVLVPVSLFLLFSWAAAQDETYYDNSYARMSYVSGDTYVQRAQDLGMEAGTVNLAVIAGDQLGTREGRLEIHFGEQNYLRLDGQTQVDVIQLPTQSQDLVKLHLKDGEVFLRISYLAEAQGFELHTRDASFYAMEEGLYRIRTGQNGETELNVIEGSMEAAGENTSEVVNAQERVVASEGRFIFGPARQLSPYTDAFSDWNRGRDALLARPAGSGYLPEELGAYERELADGGRWSYQSPYGYVWVPHVYHETWRPYSYGRWVWYPVIGYTWVSSYSWGWCVSHYGRWQWRFGLGWYWIPRSGWGPAWVHWYHGTHHYGWSALSYHGYPGLIINNHYYGDRYYGSYPLNSRTMVTVRKNQLRDPNISRVALSSSQTRGMGKVRLSSRQPAAGAAAGTSRSAGMARISSKSSLKTYGRSSTSRVSPGTASRSGSTGTSNRAIGSSSRGVYPSRSGTATRSALPQSRASSRSTSGSSDTYPSRTIRGVGTQSRGSSSSRTASRGSVSANRSSSSSSAARGAYPSRSGVSTRSSSSAARSARGAYPSRSGSANRTASAQSRTSARPPLAGYRSARSSSGSRSVRSAPGSAAPNSSASRSRSSIQSRGSSSSRTASRGSVSTNRSSSSSSASRGSVSSSRGVASSPSRSSGSLGRSTRSTSTPRGSSSRSSSSMRSSGRSSRPSGRSTGSARTSSSSRSGSRVRKK